MPTQTRNIRPTPDGRWRLRYKLGGRDVKRIFDTAAEAKEALRMQRQRILAKGKAALTLKAQQDARILILLEEMSEGQGYEHGLRRLEKAARYYRKNANGDKEPTVAEAVDDLIANWRKTGRNPIYISNAGGLLRRFGASFPNRTLRSLAPREVMDWLTELQAKDPKTPKARLSKLFSYAKFNRWVSENIVKDIQLDRRKAEAVRACEKQIVAELQSAFLHIPPRSEKQ